MEQVEAAAAVPLVERFDLRDRRLQDLRVAAPLRRLCVLEVAEDREADPRIEVSERLHLEVLDELVHARSAREQCRDHHHRLGLLGHARLEVEPRQPARLRERRHQPLHDARGEVARGQEREQGEHDLDLPRGAELVGGPRGRGDHGRGHERDPSEVAGRGVAEDRAPQALARAGAVRHAPLERAPAGADQVIADVPRRVVGAPFVGRSRLLRGGERRFDLRLAARLRQLLDRLPVAVAAREVHASVDARRIALENLLDEADALHRAAPVVAGAKAKAGDGVGERHLRRGLGLLLGEDQVLDGATLRAQALLEARSQLPGARAELAHAREQLDHECRRQLARQRPEVGVAALGFERGDERVGAPTGLAARQHLVGQAPHVLDQGGLERARPGPDLADAERRHGLVRREEALESLHVEPRVAVAQELHGEQVDPRRRARSGRGDQRKLAVVGRRQVPAQLGHLGLDQVEVVEQPLGRGRHGDAAMDVVGELAIRLAQRGGVVADAAVVGAAARAPPRERALLRGQSPRAVLQPLDVQQLRAKRARRDRVGAQARPRTRQSQRNPCASGTRRWRGT